MPVLLATFFSTIAGLIAVSFYQKLNLFKPAALLYLGGLSVLVAGIVTASLQLPQEQVGVWSSTAGNVILISIIAVFVGLAAFKKVNVYESFIEGAKEGFQVAVRVIPYLVAILVAVGVFRACGAMTFITDGIALAVQWAGLPTDFVPALPVAFMKPLSGSGARGLMVDVMQNYGPDSLPGRLACMMQGATDTTFYVLAVYFGSVGIKKTRHALTCGLIADVIGIIAAIFLAHLFF